MTPETTMSDEEVIETLLRQSGWEFHLIDEKSGFYGMQHRDGYINYVHREDFARVFGDLLSSRDALDPVLRGLSGEEWERLVERENYGECSPRTLLTLPPADLARAIASVIKEGV